MEGPYRSYNQGFLGVPGAGIGEDAGAVDALEEGLDDGVLLGHHDLRVAAPEVVDVVDGAVHILHHLNELEGVSELINNHLKWDVTSMVHARSPYSVLRLAAGGGPKVRLLASLGPE